MKNETLNNVYTFQRYWERTLDIFEKRIYSMIASETNKLIKLL